MKKLSSFLFIAIIFLSCKKENNSFIPQYQAVSGTWITQAISSDSSGVNITRTTRFNKLIINDNLGYQIYKDQNIPVEYGTVDIITQTSEKLEIYFNAKYPGYSSFAGSHIFGFSNTVLFTLTKDEMIFKSAYTGLDNKLEFYFTKN